MKLFDDDISDLNLIKYQVSNNCIIFFMIHTAKKVLDDKDIIINNDKENIIGIEFFVFMTIQ